MRFKDYFSETAITYATYRPDYPRELFTYLASLVTTHDCAWDCGTGNGQAALMLSDFFKQVIATDASEQQIQAAQPKPNISYRVATAEKTDILDQSIDLITVAQALHWFDFAAFYREAKRVLKPQGVLAAWAYGLVQSTPSINQVIDQLYYDITRPYWPTERNYFDDEYRSIPFPLQRIASPSFHIEKNWDLSQLLGYFNTWSGSQAYQKKTGTNPLTIIANDLIKVWGDAHTQHLLRWPIFLLVGKF